MAIRAINAMLSLPVLNQISSLTSRVKNVIQQNTKASQDAQAIALVTTAAASFGIFGRSVVGIGTNNFSLKASLIWGAIGGLAGILASSPLIHRFVSKFNERESQI